MSNADELNIKRELSVVINNVQNFNSFLCSTVKVFSIVKFQLFQIIQFDIEVDFEKYFSIHTFTKLVYFVCKYHLSIYYHYSVFRSASACVNFWFRFLTNFIKNLYKQTQM
jgi:hypothetical protein